MNKKEREERVAAKTIVELEDDAYDAFRELESRLTKSPPGKATKRVKRKKKYVSPRRREAYVPTEVVCAECKLPSAKGLPPFIRLNRLLEGEVVAIIRHMMCPRDADKILVALIAQRNFQKARYEEWKTTQRTWKRH